MEVIVEPAGSAPEVLEHYRLAPMKPISYTARDGMKLYGYLTTPVDKEPKNLPTVVLVHGGPWGRDVWGYNSTVQWLANRGYAVLQINFRGSAGYGKQYLNAGDRQWAGAMALAERVRTNADPTIRFAIASESAGPDPRRESASRPAARLSNCRGGAAFARCLCYAP
jgi:pimeloyl-ACP methyl ester carboxylesterase